jgi:hypothetical protein
MGLISRFLSMLFLVTLPVKFIIWSLIFLFAFSVLAIKSLINHSGYYNNIELQTYLSENHNDFLKQICQKDIFESCMFSTGVFSKDHSKIAHSYASYIEEGLIKNIEHQSIIDTNVEIFTTTNLSILKTIKEGCVEFEKTTPDLINHYKLKTETLYNRSYICVKRDMVFTLFTKGQHCETCIVKLNNYFNKSSRIIFYGYQNNFFDRTARYVNESISLFFIDKSTRIKNFFSRTLKKMTKSALTKIDSEAQESASNPSSLSTSGQDKDAQPVTKSDAKSDSLSNSNVKQNDNSNVQNTSQDGVDAANKKNKYLANDNKTDQASFAPQNTKESYKPLKQNTNEENSSNANQTNLNSTSQKQDILRVNQQSIPSDS